MRGREISTRAIYGGERISVIEETGRRTIKIDIYPRELDVDAFPAAADVAITVSYSLAVLSI